MIDVDDSYGDGYRYGDGDGNGYGSVSDNDCDGGGNGYGNGYGYGYDAGTIALARAITPDATDGHTLMNMLVFFGGQRDR